MGGPLVLRSVLVSIRISILTMNITVSYLNLKPLFIRESKSPHENYNFIELQAGCTPIPKNAFLLGAESDLCFIKRREGRKLDP